MKPSYQTDFFNQIKNYSNSTAGFERYRYSGKNLLSKINPGESVIDVGCGPNFFKDRIENLVGIDPANDAADLKIKVEDYQPETKFDVAFCLGSFRYGTQDYIRYMISCLSNNVLKPAARIYWRCRTESTGVGAPGAPKVSSSFDVYFWTVEDHRQWPAEYGFELADLKIENPGDANYERIYAEWVRH